MLMRSMFAVLAAATLLPAPASLADDLDVAFEDLSAEAAIGIADFEAQDTLSRRDRRQLRALRKVVRLIDKERDSLRREGRVALKLATVLSGAGLAEMDGDSEYSMLLDDILLEYDDAIFEALDRADTAASLIPEAGVYERTEAAVERVDAVLDRTFDVEKLIPYVRIYSRAGTKTSQLIRRIAKTAARQPSTLTLLIDGTPVAANEFHAAWTTDPAGNTRLTGGGSVRADLAAPADACVVFGTEENMEEEDFFDIDPEFDPNGAFASLQLSAAASPDGIARDFTATAGDLDIAFLGLEFGMVEGEFEFTATVGDPDDPDAEVDVTEGVFVIFGVQFVDERN